MAVPRCAAGVPLIVEPEIGVRAFNGDLADLFDPGLSVGAAAAVDPSPRLRMFARLDFSFHPSAGDTAYSQVKQGVTIGTALGGRFHLLREATSRVQPYLGLEAGFTFFNWSLADDYVAALVSEFDDHRDGIAALTVGGEAGVMFHARSHLDLGLAARFRYHLATDTPPHGFQSLPPKTTPGTNRDFDGNELGLTARASFPIRIGHEPHEEK